jgi:hypothetical protein
MNKHVYIDVTVSDPNGAPPKAALLWKPLDTNKMNWNHRRTRLNDAPSLIGRQSTPAPVDGKLLKVKPNVDSV